MTTISTSKIKKIMPIKKNFKEKGTRDNENGSNPHSNGEFFSFISKMLNFKIKEIINKAIIITKIILIILIII